MSDTTTDFFDNLGSGGAPTAVLKNVNDFVQGEIVSMSKRDVIKFGTKDEIEKNKDGSNRQQLVVILQTTHRNWANVVKVPKDAQDNEKPPSDDDGKRAVYIPEHSNIQFEVGIAVQAAKAPFEVGGTLGVKVVELEDTGKGNPLKKFKAKYEPKNEAGDFVTGGQGAPATEQPAAQEQAQAPAPSAPPVQDDPWATPAGGDEPPF